MFGNFVIRRSKPGEWDKGSPEGWTVSLPHQCDDWQITGEKYAQPVSHEQAVADLEEFIQEAQNALEKLKAKEEIKQEWP